VAIKTIRKRTIDYEEKIKLLREEAVLLSTLDHINIVRLLEEIKAGPLEYFVMEYCAGGDIRGLIGDAKHRK
jgi:serine/threonine protein kinase